MTYADVDEVRAESDEWADWDGFFTSVWSSYGHRFYAEDGYERCMTCGAVYEISPDREMGPGYGRYHASNGDDPKGCTGLTNLEHGYEAVCQAEFGRGCEASDDGPCEHLAVEHGCNCLMCTG